MATLSGLCVLLLAALSRAVAGDNVTPVYFTDGDVLTLNVTRSDTKPIQNILWKFNGNLLAERVQNKAPLELFGTFIGRTDLSIADARLVVRNMSKADTGAYSVEINSKVHAQSYDAKWIKVLRQPEVVMRPLTCSPVSESCTLSCEADTTEAGPVTHSWKMGVNQLKVSTKDMQINKTDHVNDETITCLISNPLGEQVSAPINNPFYVAPTNNTPGIVVPILLVLCVVVVVVVVLVLWKRKLGPFKNRDATKTVSTTLSPLGGVSGTPSEEHGLTEKGVNETA
ncbi:uncharacterized protein LOC130206903 [Pseudoliparis swirei]|uniref:uncharacterized protein LOC130206903 n=1 Tax=Pseudoliparis swirei TaxID=2059687 RepID=UPI0024BE3D01|nr:uncharacterized protein LOC130206903 [Pseudoliparis swirei]